MSNANPSWLYATGGNVDYASWTSSNIADTNLQAEYATDTCGGHEFWAGPLQPSTPVAAPDHSTYHPFSMPAQGFTAGPEDYFQPPGSTIQNEPVLKNTSVSGSSLSMENGTNFVPSPMSPMFLPSHVGAHQHRRLPRDEWTAEQDNLLLNYRRAGWEYSRIAQEMRVRFGVETTENRLVKRLQKIQTLYLEPLPKAVEKAMPEIMTCIKDEMRKIGLDDVSGKDKDLLDQIMMELPRNIPKFVQNRVMTKRKALLNTSLTRE